jgi:hypothetical protein
MDKSIFAIYKVPFLISLSMTIAILALTGIGQPIEMASVIVAGFLAMFVLDAEYVLNAYFLDTETDFSKTLVGFIKHSDWKNALKYIYYHKDETTENSLNSALFQMVIACMSIFVIYATTSIFAKALVLVVFAQSIYVLIEYYFKDRTDDWFWALKAKPSKQNVRTYTFVLLLILSYCLYIF